jgi:hypothetical protein
MTDDDDLNIGHTSGGGSDSRKGTGKSRTDDSKLAKLPSSSYNKGKDSTDSPPKVEAEIVGKKSNIDILSILSGLFQLGVIVYIISVIVDVVLGVDIFFVP